MWPVGIRLIKNKAYVVHCLASQDQDIFIQYSPIFRLEELSKEDVSPAVVDEQIFNVEYSLLLALSVAKRSVVRRLEVLPG